MTRLCLISEILLKTTVENSDDITKEIIEFKRNFVKPEHTIEELNEDDDKENFKDKYLRQIVRFLRIFYFITLKCKEFCLHEMLQKIDSSKKDEIKNLRSQMF